MRAPIIAKLMPVMCSATLLAGVGACADTRSNAAAPRADSVELVVLAPYQEGRFTCPACRIQVGTVVDVGEGVYGPHRLGSIVRRDHIGRYWMSRTYEEGVVGIYDSSGHFLTKLGSAGDGPGELRTITGMAEGTQGMYLADRGTNRLNVFDDSLRLVRMHPLKFAVRALEVRADERLVAWFDNPFGPTPASIHLLSDSGRYITSLGRTPEFASETQEILQGDHVIATGSSGDILVGDASRYAIKVIRDGRLIRELSSPVNWFDSYAEWTQEKPVSIARMTSIAVDDADRAWVLFSLPEPSYRKAKYEIGTDRVTPMVHVHARFNTAIEVWDLTTGRLLTGVVVAPRLFGFADSRHVYTYIETTSGEVRARVWRLTLDQSNTLPRVKQ